MRDTTIIMVPRVGEEYREDFAAIAGLVEKLDCGLHARVVHEPGPLPDISGSLRGQGTLTVSFRHRLPFAPLGTTYSCRHVPKIEQVRHYKAAGVRFPRARVFAWGVELQPEEWGPFVVLKPMQLGRMSHGNCHLLPTRLVRHLKPSHFAPGHPVHTGPMLLQRFIDTGERPSSFRVLTLFGEPLYAMEIVLKHPRPRLDSPLKEIIGTEVASNSGPRERTMINSPDVLAFAREMAKAMPGVPLQGLDILRDCRSGVLFAIESNPGGNTWHFSSRLAEKMREEMGDGKAILLNQFNAYDTAARTLVGMARARVLGSRGAGEAKGSAILP